MAPRNAQAAELMEAERADREENADINEAIARTESEVFNDALSDKPLEDDAGTELEEMGDGLEGEQLEDEDKEEQPAAKEQKAAPEGEQPAEAEQPAEEAEAAPEGDEQATPPAVEQRPRPSIPPRVLIETRERARETENELRAQLRDMQMRIDNLSRQPPPQPAPQPQPAQPTQRPDLFADPEGHDNWLIAQAEQRAEARFNERFNQYQQQQQQTEMQRLDEALAQTARGPRSYEFNTAYRDLTSLDKTPENATLVRRIVTAPDPGQAILDWWEQSSNPEYIEYHRDQVRQAYGNPRPQRGNGGPQRQNGQLQNRQATPRHEVRLPRSLSEAAGGRSQHVTDPEMFDGSEESIFAYGARR